jgi:ubiquinone/menaquinone biosynthesis C-methylase UbiE
MADTKRETKDRFDLEAPTYGASTRQADRLTGLEKAAILRLTLAKSPSRVIEVGCGWGRYLSLLAKSCEDVVGVDFSENMLRTAIERLVEAKSIHLVLADAEHLPFRSSVFDAACFIRSLKWIPNHTSALDEARRILTACGAVVVYDVRNALSSNGLIVSGKSLMGRIGLMRFNREPLPPTVSLMTLATTLRMLGFVRIRVLGLVFFPEYLYQYAEAWRLIKVFSDIDRVLSCVKWFRSFVNRWAVVGYAPDPNQKNEPIGTSEGRK